MAPVGLLEESLWSRPGFTPNVRLMGHQKPTGSSLQITEGHVPPGFFSPAQGVVTPSAVEVKVACTQSIRCVGAGSLTAVVGKGKVAHKVIVAQGRFTIPAGKSETVSFGETAHAGSVLGTHSSKAIVGELTITLAGGKKTAHRVVLARYHVAPSSASSMGSPIPLTSVAAVMIAGGARWVNNVGVAWARRFEPGARVSCWREGSPPSTTSWRPTSTGR